MRVLLDTQVLFMAATGAQFSKRVQSVLASLDNELLLSSISILEIALKHARKKIDMPEALVRQAVQDLALTLVAFEPLHAYRLFTLPMHLRGSLRPDDHCNRTIRRRTVDLRRPPVCPLQGFAGYLVGMASSKSVHSGIGRMPLCSLPC